MTSEMTVGLPPEQADDDEDDRDEDEEGDDEADAESEVGGRGAARGGAGRVRRRPGSHRLRAVQYDRVEPPCKSERQSVSERSLNRSLFKGKAKSKQKSFPKR